MRTLLGLSISVTTKDNCFVPNPTVSELQPVSVLRWRGFAAAITSGFYDRLVVIGGREVLSEREVPDYITVLPQWRLPEGMVAIPRGLATIETLHHQYDVPRERMRYEESEGNTAGNIALITDKYLTRDTKDELAVCSEFTHLLRAQFDLSDTGRVVKLIPAEAFLLATAAKASDERRQLEVEVMAAYGDTPLAEMIVSETSGIADKLRGEYVPRSK